MGCRDPHENPGRDGAWPRPSRPPRASFRATVPAREKAFGDFIEVGLPHRRVEDFKYTDLRAAHARGARPSRSGPSPPRREAAALAAARRSANRRDQDRDRQRPCGARGLGPRRLPAGRRDHDRSARRSASGHPLLEASEPGAACRAKTRSTGSTRRSWRTACSSASLRDGVERPIHLRFVTAGAEPVATATRTLVVVEEGASRHAAREPRGAGRRRPPAQRRRSSSSSGDRAKVVPCAPQRRGPRRARALDADGPPRRGRGVRHPQRGRRAAASRAIRCSSTSRATVRLRGSTAPR